MSTQPYPFPGELGSTSELLAGHVLYIDIVGYSRHSMEEMGLLLTELQDIVRKTSEVATASLREDVVIMPRGDGMALVFFRDSLSPLRCAVQLDQALMQRSHIHVRMGINTGPVYLIHDVNGNKAASGYGVVMAQRVMDCGDRGHILLSTSMADYVARLDAWKPYIEDLGMCSIKHGERIHLFNFYTREAGNRQAPLKVLQQASAAVDGRAVVASRNRKKSRLSIRTLATLTCLLFAVSVGGSMAVPSFRTRVFKVFQASESPKPIISNQVRKELPEPRISEPAKTYHEEPITTPPIRAPKVKTGATANGNLQIIFNPITDQPGSGVSSGQEDPNTVVSTPEIQSSSTYEIGVYVGFDGKGEREVRVEYDDAGVPLAPSDLQAVLGEGSRLTRPKPILGSKVTVRVYYNNESKPGYTETFSTRNRRANDNERE